MLLGFLIVGVLPDIDPVLMDGKRGHCSAFIEEALNQVRHVVSLPAVDKLENGRFQQVNTCIYELI